MEETKIGTEKTSLTLTAFDPRRRRHLKSGTYRTLVRILSHCYDESFSVPQEPNQDNESVQATEKEVGENAELATREGGLADESCEDNGFREQLEQIESILSVDENEDFSKLNGVMDIEDILAIDFEDLGFGAEQMLTDEQGWIAKGNEDNAHKSLAVSLDEDQSGSAKVALLTNREGDDETVRCESEVQMVSGTLGSSLNTVVMGESSNQGESNEQQHSLLKTNTLDVNAVMQQKAMELETSVSSEGAKESFIPITEVGRNKEPENISQKVPDGFDFSSNKDMVAEASNPTEYSKDKSSSQETNHLEVDREMQQKDKELEKIVCSRTEMNSPNHMNNGDIEEGEISGGDGMDERSMDMLLHDTIALEEKNVHEVQVFKDVINRKEHPFKEAKDKDFDSSSFLVDMVDKGKIGSGVEITESSSTEMIRRPGAVEGENVKSIRVDDFNPFLEGGMEDDGVRVGHGCPADGNHGTTFEEKWDAGACNKRKRGPPSKEKKERKKAKERKKRAEKNRELGVKRLKLHPIQKPKTVSYCRHYVMGRCHEGDKCKFSHDTEPLTKSKPCVHFARQSCMKGDDCPYDHQLSKYPCNNFKDNGFCIRGDRCMFSHKMPSKEDSATAACKPELKAPSVHVNSSTEQGNIGGASQQNSHATAACKPELKAPAVQGNSRSQHVNIGGASQKNTHALAYSLGFHSLNNTKQHVTETVSKQPELATKGISFPSIPKSSLVHSSMSKPEGLAPDMNTVAKAWSQIDQSPLRSVQNSSEILMRTPPVTTPKGINFLSFGRASPDDARGKSQVSHQTTPSVSESVQNLIGMLKSNRPPASQGTSFNPFGKSSVASSGSDQNLNGILWANQPAASQGKTFNPFQNSLIASSSSDQNLNGMLQANQPATPQRTSFNPFGKSLVASSSSDQNLNGMLQANQPATPQGTSFNPFGKSSVASFSNDQILNGILQANQAAASQGTSINPFKKSSVSSSSNEKPVSLSSCWDNSGNRGSHESPNTADKPQNSRTSGQSSDGMMSRFGRDTANSFQRGLFSTLAFAAKYKTQT